MLLQIICTNIRNTIFPRKITPEKINKILIYQERILSNLQEFFCLLQETNFFRADFCVQKGLSEPFDLLQYPPGHAVRAAGAVDNHVRRRAIGGKALAV